MLSARTLACDANPSRDYADAVLRDGYCLVPDAFNSRPRSMDDAFDVDGLVWDEQLAGTRSLDADAERHPLALELLDLPILNDTLQVLFENHASLLTAYFRHSTSGAYPLPMHCDYPRSWPLHKKKGSYWAPYPCVVAMWHPCASDGLEAPLVLVPGSHLSGSHPLCEDVSTVADAVRIRPTSREIVLMDARAWHGVEGTSTERLSLLLNFSFSWIRRPRDLNVAGLKLTPRQERMVSQEIRQETKEHSYQ